MLYQSFRFFLARKPTVLQAWVVMGEVSAYGSSLHGIKISAGLRLANDVEVVRVEVRVEESDLVVDALVKKVV